MHIIGDREDGDRLIRKGRMEIRIRLIIMMKQSVYEEIKEKFGMDVVRL